MSSEFDLDEIEFSDVIEGVTAVLLAPVILPIASGMQQPLVKNAIKEGMAFSDRCKEAIAVAREQIEDSLAEARAEVEQAQSQPSDAPDTEVEQAQSQSSDAADTGAEVYRAAPMSTVHTADGVSQSAGEVMNAVSEINAQVGWLTNGVVDLRVLMPLGLGAIALRQLATKGLQIDELPWYAFAWYAFDSFNKLNQTEQPQSRPAIAGSDRT